MAMIKVVSPSGWDWDGPVASLVKVASGGLRGHDRSAFIKRAGASANVFLPYLDAVKFAADEEPVHLIALGAGEGYGANRNGDYFGANSCRKYHDTFVKFAKPFRNHKNRPQEGHPHYGTVKLSAYNEPMKRVELLVALNKEKSAAERTGGLVADKELEKLAKDGSYDTSMACRIPFDLCSYCSNKARTRDEYCTADMCKAGGCKDNLTKLIKVGGELHHLCVHNPDPTWFDISSVIRRADRVAQATPADWLTKSAAELFAEGGAKLAEDLGLEAPLAVLLHQDLLPGAWPSRLQQQLKLAHALAVLEADPRLGRHESRRAFSADVQPDLDHAALGLDTTQPLKLAASLAALTDQEIILPLREFAKLTKRAELLAEAAAFLPGVYRHLATSGTLERRLQDNPYVPAEKLAAAGQRSQALRLHASHSLAPAAIQQRMLLSSIRGCQVPLMKTAAVTAPISAAARELACDYALYKVAALERLATVKTDLLLTARAALVQNYVS